MYLVVLDYVIWKVYVKQSLLISQSFPWAIV